jgi:nitrogen fixation NifU-like protein
VSSAAPLTDLYRQVILANAVNPCGRGVEIEATHRATRNNPLCGDDIELSFNVGAGIVTAAAFAGQACAICLASASLLCRHAPGCSTEEFVQLAAGFQQALAGRTGTCADYLAPLLGVRVYPARVACAALPWETGLAALAGELPPPA